MATPKNVKQAFENGKHRVKKIYSKGSKTIRVDFEPKYPRSDKHCSFWIDREYFKRNYPKIYDRY